MKKKSHFPFLSVSSSPSACSSVWLPQHWRKRPKRRNPLSLWEGVRVGAGRWVVRGGGGNQNGVGWFMKARICSFIRVAQAGKPAADLRNKSRDLHLQGLQGLLVLSPLSRTLSFFSFFLSDYSNNPRSGSNLPESKRPSKLQGRSGGIFEGVV